MPSDGPGVTWRGVDGAAAVSVAIPTAQISERYSMSSIQRRVTNAVTQSGASATSSSSTISPTVSGVTGLVVDIAAA